MYRIAIDEVPEGTRLGMSVFNENGRPLVKAGAVLVPRTLDHIRLRGYCRLVLLDEGEEIQSEFLAAETKAIVLEALGPAVRFLRETWRSQRGIKAGDGEKLDLALRAAVRTFVQHCQRAFADGTRLTLPGNVRRGGEQWLDDAVHAAAVAVYVGVQFAFDDSTLARLAHGMLLRDIGMLILPEEVRETPGALSPEAWEAIRQHPVLAYETLCTVGWMDEAARLVVLQHHERQNGRGYPYGLAGLHRVERSRRDRLDRDLTLHVSDVAAVADIFNAMTADRPHRPSRACTEVREALTTMAGDALNEEVVRSLLASWEPPSEERPAPRIPATDGISGAA